LNLLEDVDHPDNLPYNHYGTGRNRKRFQKIWPVAHTTLEWKGAAAKSFGGYSFAAISEQ